MREKLEYDYSKLIGRIYEKGLNKTKFAKLIGLSTAQLYNIFKNKYYLNQSQIDKAKEILEIADEDILVYFFTRKVKKNFTKSN